MQRVSILGDSHYILLLDGRDHLLRPRFLQIHSPRLGIGMHFAFLEITFICIDWPFSASALSCN